MWLISRAAQHPNVQQLAIAVVGVRAFAIARALLRYGERLLAHDAALRLLVILRLRVFAALHPLAPASLSGYGRGDLLRRFIGDVDGAQDGLIRAFVPAAGAAITATGAVLLATMLAPTAGLVLLVAIILAGVGVPLIVTAAVGAQDENATLIGSRDAQAAALVEALDELSVYGAAGRDHLRVASPTTASCDRLAARPGWLPRAPHCRARSQRSRSLLSSPPAQSQFGRAPGIVELAVLAACVLAAFDAVAGLPAATGSWARSRAGLTRVSDLLRPTTATPARSLADPSVERDRLTAFKSSSSPLPPAQRRAAQCRPGR